MKKMKISNSNSDLQFISYFILTDSLISNSFSKVGQNWIFLSLLNEIKNVENKILMIWITHLSISLHILNSLQKSWYWTYIKFELLKWNANIWGQSFHTTQMYVCMWASYCMNYLTYLILNSMVHFFHQNFHTWYTITFRKIFAYLYIYEWNTKVITLLCELRLRLCLRICLRIALSPIPTYC
jgi:hypothetical protein